MKKIISLSITVFALTTATFAQEKESKENIAVPVVVKTALNKKYAEAKNITWEKENGNYEANWGGKSGEDYSVQFTPAGNFIEMVQAIPVSTLPPGIADYVKQHYKNAKITEAGKVTDAAGKTSYEAEVKGKDVIFDEHGAFVTSE